MESPIKTFVDNGGIRFYPDAGDKKDELLDELRRTNQLLALQVRLLGSLVNDGGGDTSWEAMELDRIMGE